MAKRSRPTKGKKRVSKIVKVEEDIEIDVVTVPRSGSSAPALPQPKIAPIVTGKLALVHVDELNKIWPQDPRIPSVPSRRAWALARGVAPQYVHQWWQRRRPIAKKLRMRIPKETYELAVGTPPVIPTIVKDEPDASATDLPAVAPAPVPTRTNAPTRRSKRLKIEYSSDGMPPSSSPTLLGSCAPSSDAPTMFSDTDSPPPPDAPKLYVDRAYSQDDFTSQDQSSASAPRAYTHNSVRAIDISTQPDRFSAPIPAKEPEQADTQESAEPFCNMGHSTDDASSFTCSLCSMESAPDDIDVPALCANQPTFSFDDYIFESAFSADTDDMKADLDPFLPFLTQPASPKPISPQMPSIFGSFPPCTTADSLFHDYFMLDDRPFAFDGMCIDPRESFFPSIPAYDTNDLT